MTASRIALLASAIGVALILIFAPRANAADALLIVQRPGEEAIVKHRFANMTTCTVDLPSEVYVHPKGTRLACVVVHERKEATAR